MSKHHGIGRPQVGVSAANWVFEVTSTSGDIFEMLFPICNNMEEAPKCDAELKKLDKRVHMV